MIYKSIKQLVNYGLNNGYGWLGNKTTSESYEPIQILDDVVRVSLGSSHSAAIKKDGSLWIWGSNWYGERGDSGEIEDKNGPRKLMDDVKEVSLGNGHSAAIKKDGTLWCWGENNGGQIGKKLNIVLMTVLS